MKHISFPSIEQFRSVVKHVNDRCDYSSLTAKPTIRFHGTVKLHGTNASIVLNSAGSLYAQSREQLIFPEKDKDNAGFAEFVDNSAEAFRAALAKTLLTYNTVGFMNSTEYEARDAHTVVVYGEWCGGEHSEERRSQ